MPVVSVMSSGIPKAVLQAEQYIVEVLFMMHRVSHGCIGGVYRYTSDDVRIRSNGASFKLNIEIVTWISAFRTKDGLFSVTCLNNTT
jgi:hypothetical protein